MGYAKGSRENITLTLGKETIKTLKGIREETNIPIGRIVDRLVQKYIIGIEIREVK